VHVLVSKQRWALHFALSVAACKGFVRPLSPGSKHRLAGGRLWMRLLTEVETAVCVLPG
jgi:hypothetical protein